MAAKKKENTNRKVGNFYITTTLPYVNADPHIGHALEFVRADIIARYKKLSGFDVFFNIGTDEHGAKVYKKAKELGLDPKTYVDDKVNKFVALKERLGLLEDVNFVRTTDERHIEAAKEFWRICDKNGFIYKKNYKIKYCVGCELEKTESDLVDGKCPIHPNIEIEIIDEENYFFKFSAFQKELLTFYDKCRDFVIPQTKFNEIRSFVSRGLEDFSISRLKDKMPWGIDVPGDDKHVMYVWFDALVNYISVIGWPFDMDRFKKWWIDSGGAVQYCGKDNLRQQSAMWQAMLLAAGLPNSRKIIIDGFVTAEGGVKMSKSLGNVVDPLQIIKEYGTDAFRYYVAREISSFEDSPFSMEMFKKAYNANLANGLGNLVSRVMKMAVNANIKLNEDETVKFSKTKEAESLYKKQIDGLESYDIKSATDTVWQSIALADKEIQDKQPFKLIKSDRLGAEKIIVNLLARIDLVSEALKPIMPETASKINNILESGKMPDPPLFPRKD